MKITIKILENVVNEEKTDPEQSFAPPVSAEQLRQEPIAAYIMQTLNREWPTLASQRDLEQLQNRIADLETKMGPGVANIPSELKEIIAEETTKLVLENVEDCEAVRLEDLDLIEDLFDKICEFFDEYIENREAEITRKQNTVEDPDTELDGMSGIGGEGRPMPADEPSGQTHTVVAGDTFWELARQYLGNPLRWKEVMNANMDLLKNRKKMKFRLTDELIPPIRPGDELQIPPR